MALEDELAEVRAGKAEKQDVDARLDSAEERLRDTVRDALTEKIEEVEDEEVIIEVTEHNDTGSFEYEELVTPEGVAQRIHPGKVRELDVESYLDVVDLEETADALSAYQETGEPGSIVTNDTRLRAAPGNYKD